MEIIPESGFKGLLQNWQSDMLAAVSVALVALPLGLGIAIASGVPPMAGIISAIIGGVVTTFFRGSNLAINGATAGLIAVILGSIAALDDGSGKVLQYVFAAIMVSGFIQVILGLLKMGKYADLFHSTVIHGILAAIGVIIVAKQIHIAMGTTSDADSIVGTLIDAFIQIPNINPFVACISAACLFVLVFHSKISFRFFHWLPAPMWVLVLAIPFVYLFDFFNPHIYNLFGRDYAVGPQLLINIPDNILDAIIYPDFSKINTLPFWISVISITMIASIESLASAKAIDKLDQYKRKTDLNKDLVGVGLSTMICGAIGGLPIINVIVRSTVNVHNNAKTKWSNLYHGIFLLIFVFLLTPVIQMVPLSALAILLVYTGYKLASPTVFKHVYEQGIEQLIFFTGTLIITLFTNLLVGVFGGLLLALFAHMLLANVPFTSFFNMIIHSGSEVKPRDDGSYEIKIRGIANFLSTMNIDKLVGQIPEGKDVEIDLSEARIVDHSILEHLYDFKRTQSYSGGQVTLFGLEKHVSSSRNKLAMRVLTGSVHKLSHRQLQMKELAVLNNWNFLADPEDYVEYYQTFYFFKTRPLRAKVNRIFGQDRQVNWEIVDVTFQEGAYMSADEYKTTLGLIRFPFFFPKFTIEKKEVMDRILNLSAHKDIDYVLYPKFSSDFVVKVEDISEMDSFITPAIRKLIEESEVVHHIESNGEAVLLFTDNILLAPLEDYPKIVEFTKQLKEQIVLNIRDSDPVR